MHIGVVSSVEPLGEGLHRFLARGLTETARRQGHAVEQIMLPFAAGESVIEQAWAFRSLYIKEPFDRAVTLRPPAHLVTHPYKVAWLSTHLDYAGGATSGAVEQRIAKADQTALIAAERVLATSGEAAHHWEARSASQVVVLRAPSPMPLGRPKVFGHNTFTILHPGQVRCGARLQQIAKALPFADRKIGLHICGGIIDPVLAEEVLLLAARLQPGSLSLCKRRLGPEEARDAISQSDAMICLSSDDDIALAVIDRAGVEGRPVIVSADCPAAAAYVAEFNCGIVVDPNEPHAIAAAMNELAGTSAGAAEMGAAGAAALKLRPSWEVVLQELVGG